jgi:hypothetical protein
MIRRSDVVVSVVSIMYVKYNLGFPAIPVGQFTDSV